MDAATTNAPTLLNRQAGGIHFAGLESNVYLKRDGGHEILPVVHTAPAVNYVRQAAAVHILEHDVDTAILRNTHARTPSQEERQARGRETGREMEMGAARKEYGTASVKRARTPAGKKGPLPN